MRNPAKNLGHFLCAQLVLGALLLASPDPALAQSERYRARLSPMPTTPSTADEITGEGEVFFTLEGNTLIIEGEFAGMSSAATGAHLHNGPPAQPGPVVITLEVSAAASGEISGRIEMTDALMQALLGNALYVQVHSVNNPPGELRGWVFPLSHFQNL